MNNAIEKIAKILRADRDYIADIERRFSELSGKTGVLEKIIQENENLICDRVCSLRLRRNAGAKEVYDALIVKIEADDHRLFKALGNPDIKDPNNCQNIAEAALKIANQPKGFFLKTEKAEELLIKEPPRRIMRFLGYDSPHKMLAQENLFEVYSGLRFIEDGDWLNNVFFKQYQSLTPDDFEEREIKAVALSEKWGKVAEKFAMKKWHNISHLKELGVVFVIPILSGVSGEILRMFSLIFHYLYEIQFYSGIFRDIGRDESVFAGNFISLLRGDVIDRHFEDGQKPRWLVIQRYLAKDDENDWRLFTPHINPEALHWSKAADNLAVAGAVLNNFAQELKFWQNLDWVGDYFQDETGLDDLVSFNLVDTVMSLVQQKERIKYLYHHQEALWNKIFSEYFGQEKLEEYARKYLLQGWFEI